MSATLNKPFILTTVYTVSSIAVGPLIFLVAINIPFGGGDYCDRAYWGLPEQTKIHDFRRAEVFQTVASGLMIVVGAALLGWLWVSIARHRHDHPEALKPIIFGAAVTLLTLAMMCGYLLLVAHADLSAGQSS